LFFLFDVQSFSLSFIRGEMSRRLIMDFWQELFGELMKKLDIHVSVARLNEPQLVFAATVMQNDRDWFRDNGKGQKSVFDQTKISMTTHTPEAAALPYWDLSHIRAVVGADLVRNEIVVNGHVVNAAIGLARMANIIKWSCRRTCRSNENRCVARI